MFSLVIAIVSILLVGALAAAAVYYGGNAYQDSGKKADALQLVNQGVQVKAAAEIYKANEGRYPNNLAEMSGSYLKGVPSDSSWTSQSGFALVQDVDLDRCKEANKALKIDTIPQCGDPAYANRPVCCTTE